MMGLTNLLIVHPLSVESLNRSVSRSGKRHCNLSPLAEQKLFNVHTYTVFTFGRVCYLFMKPLVDHITNFVSRRIVVRVHIEIRVDLFCVFYSTMPRF